MLEEDFRGTLQFDCTGKPRIESCHYLLAAGTRATLAASLLRRFRCALSARLSNPLGNRSRRLTPNKSARCDCQKIIVCLMSKALDSLSSSNSRLLTTASGRRSGAHRCFFFLRTHTHIYGCHDSGIAAASDFILTCWQR